MIAACMKHQVGLPAMPAYDWLEGFVDIKYGSTDDHGRLVPNAGTPYFMKSIVLGYYP